MDAADSLDSPDVTTLGVASANETPDSNEYNSVIHCGHRDNCLKPPEAQILLCCQPHQRWTEVQSLRATRTPMDSLPAYTVFGTEPVDEDPHLNLVDPSKTMDPLLFCMGLLGRDLGSY